jgi:hypothetical protein
VTDVPSDPEKVLRHFEPGSEGEAFVSACTIAAGQLMELLQGQFGDEYSLSGRIDNLERRIDVLQDTLENAIRVAGSVLEALKRLEAKAD